MTPRKRSKKKINDILKLKIVFEEKEVVKDEFEIGVQELNEILGDLSKTVNKEQDQAFNELFFGGKQTDKPNDTDKIIPGKFDLITPDTNDNPASENKKILNHPRWIKRVYKQVVQRTHPDRYIDFPVAEIKEKFTEIYRRTVDAYDDGDIGMLLLCAYETEVKVDNPEASAYIKDSISNHSNEVAQIKNKLGYQWYHLPESNRMTFLENYLKQLGFIFNRKEAEDVVRRKVQKRKVGTRPEKSRVNKRKIQ